MPPKERAPPPRSARALAVTDRAGPPAEQERRAGCGKTVRAIAGLAQCKKPTTCSSAARTSVQAHYQQFRGRADFRRVDRGSSADVAVRVTLSGARHARW